MKISCTQENLNSGLSAVSHIASKNLNLPILSNVLFKIENKILTLMATNLEIGITTDIRGKLEGDGEFSIDARLISNYISLLPKERIDLEIKEDGELKIECLNQKTTIKTQSGSDFPIIPKISKDNAIVIPVTEFKKAIGEVIFSCSNSESRPELSGVFMQIEKETIVLAATDSYRLAESKITISNNKTIDKKIIIPSKTLSEVARILSLSKEEETIDDLNNIEIYTNESQLMFSYNNIDVVTRIIEGQYPDYKQIIPSSFISKAIVNKSQLIKAIKTSSLFAKNGIYDIKLDFSTVNNEIVVNSSSVQIGENNSKVSAQISGEDSSIILNYRYLIDGLQNIGSEKVEIQIGDSNSPCLIKPAEENSYLYIIMPIRQ